ncbi:MAG TPA: cytochrome P450 [Myxococcota bacterium]|nr:cytochrome P450 [Myxococcota bacterium]
MRVDQINLLDLDEFAARGFPHDIFATLRREAPLYRHPEPSGPGFWVISKHSDVIQVSKRPLVFSSMHGVNMQVLAPEELPMIQTMMLGMDPPRHSKYRRLVSGGFTPRTISHLEPHIRQIAHRIVEEVAQKGECEFVKEVAAELPLQVIAEFLGVPDEERGRIFHLSNRLIGFDDPEFQTSPEDGKIAATEMWLYANQLAKARRVNPRNDIVSLLVNAEVEGEKLSELEFNNFFLLLAVAGNETTRNLISGGMLALLEHPRELRRLRNDPSLLPTAVEEMLRWVTPVAHFRRTATEDTEIRGQRIAAGDRVVMFYPSANRDEDVFSDPQHFDIGRTPNDHLAFGIGEHFCLGSQLARLEIRIMFEELLRQLPEIELAGPVRRLRSNFINGIKSMPVRFSLD